MASFIDQTRIFIMTDSETFFLFQFFPDRQWKFFYDQCWDFFHYQFFWDQNVPNRKGDFILDSKIFETDTDTLQKLEQFPTGTWDNVKR